MSRPGHFSYNRGQTLLITAILILSGIIGQVVVGNGEADDIEVETRGDMMGEWEKLPAEDWPSSIDTGNCEITYREASNELMVFNREGGDQWEVWSFFENNQTWFRWSTSGDEPDARFSNNAFVSSQDNGVAYFYGGYRRSGWTTYTYDKLHIFFFSNMTWMEINATQSLGGLYNSEMVYDQETDSVWIFGGRDDDGEFHNDLFQYNLTDGWNHPEPTEKPLARDQASMSITPNGTFIHVSLGRYYQQGWTSRYVDDLWYYNVGNGSWVNVTDDLGIDTYAGALMIYRTVTQDLIISMGFDDDDDINDTYVVDPFNGDVTQVNLTGGISRRHINAWDLSSDGSKVVIFGDSDNNQDIWSLDIYSLTSNLMPGNPTWSGGTAFTGYDPDDGGKLMTLKMTGNGPNDIDLIHYSLSDQVWKKMYVDIEGAPTYHSQMSGCYDPVDNAFYLYGGEYSYRVSQHTYHYYFFDEFWRLWTDDGTWERINVHAPPGKLSRATMCVDWGSEYRHVYLYGGQTHGGESEAIAKYNISGNIWNVMNPPIKPQGRRNSAIAYDPLNNGIWMFGGRDNQSSVTNYDDLWFFHINKEKWEDRSYASNTPSPRYGHSLAVNHHNGEIAVYGGSQEDDDLLHTWRSGWREWVDIEQLENPGTGWAYHSMHYSPEKELFYMWAGQGQGVDTWTYTPILRTLLSTAKLKPPEGQDLDNAYPTVGTYTIEIQGYTDMIAEDIEAINVSLKTSSDESGFIWYPSNDTITRYGNTTWFDIGPGEITISGIDLTVRFPITFTFDMPDQESVGIYFEPICTEAWTEQRRTTNAFTMNSNLDIKGYQFRTEFQEVVEDGGWLFGRSNLTAEDMEVYFSANSQVQPANSSFKIRMENQLGEYDEWIYTSGEKGNLTVPVRGEDGRTSSYWLNLSSMEDEVIITKRFDFTIDMDPPGRVQDVKVRADRVDDDIWGFDDDAREAYLTWGDVYENGSGIQGICYSVDINTWPSKANITNEFPSFQIKGGEGMHTVYVWAMDNTDRAGPVVEAKMIIDNHRVEFSNPRPGIPINVTVPKYTVRIDLRDVHSGVDLDSIQYRVTDESRQFGDWMTYEHDFTNPMANLSLSLEMDLIPEMKNLAQFRAKDLAAIAREDESSIWRTSYVFSIYYDPDLANPVVNLIGPEDGTIIEEDVTLSWSGDYIYPSNLTYEVHLTDPDGEEKTFEMGADTSMDFSPDTPGTYSWFVRALADGEQKDSDMREFTYEPSFVTITPPGDITMKEGENAWINFTIFNTLRIPVTITASLDVDYVLNISSSDIPEAEAGSTVEASLLLETNVLEPNDYPIRVVLQDNFGRSESFQISLTVTQKDIEDGDEEEEEGGYLMIIIIVLVLLVIVVLALVFFLRRKGEEEFGNIKFC